MKPAIQSMPLVLIIAVTAGLLLSARLETRGASAGPIPPDASWGRMCEGFQLQAELETLAVRPVVRAVVNCSLRNVSGRLLRVADSYPEHDYHLTVTDTRGRFMLPIGDVSEVAGRTVVGIQPGEELAQQYSLNRMYLIADAGEYTITATRLVFKSAGEDFAVVESGPVVLVVSANPAGQNAFASGEWGPVTEGFQLRIEVTPAVIPPRPPLLLRLTMHNVTKQALYLRPTSLLHEYRLGIADQEGREVPVTRDCIRLEQGPPTLGEVGPGQALTYEYDLSKKYDLLEPGEYTIVAKRRVPALDGDGWAWVESSPVVLTVSESINPM